MALRLLISDAMWSKIEPVLRELKHAAGSPPKLSNRMFIEAVLYQARTGTPWRDLPDEFGDWNAVYHRFRRWEERELWKRLWQRFQSIGDEQLKELFIDSTIVRAHQHAAGASRKNGGQQAQALGRPSQRPEAGCSVEGRDGRSRCGLGGGREGVGVEAVGAMES